MLSKLSTSIKFINSLPLRAFATSVDFSNWTEHEGLKNWIQKQVDLMQPDKVHLCDGSPEERDKLNNAMVLSGTFIPVPKRPWSYYARSHPADVPCGGSHPNLLKTKRRRRAVKQLERP